MKKSYHKSARTQDPEFLGAPQADAENLRLSPLCEGDPRFTGETTALNPHSWSCLACGEPLQLVHLYPSGRGFELLCEGTDSNPHRLRMYVSKLRKEDALFLSGGVPCKC
jgi:hypothetical protein